MMNLSSMLDSAWDVACIRAQRAGKLLAAMLAGRAHGDRPVTLIGLSVGALVAFHCLLELRTLGAGMFPRYRCDAHFCARNDPGCSLPHPG